MGGSVGCVVSARDVSDTVIEDLVSRRNVTSVFVRGAMSLPSLRGKAPVSSADGTVPGMQLTDDDSKLRGALAAARNAGADAYLVLSNPLAGPADWSDLLAEDNAGRSAAKVGGHRAVLCPSRPKLMKWLPAAAAEAARTYKPTGILLDDFSLGAPDQIDTLFMCWCDLCQTRIGELGYDADRIRLGMQGARSKLQQAGPRLAGMAGVGIGQFVEAVGYDTGLLDWLNFRADSVSACLYDIRQAVAGVDTGVLIGILTKAPTVAMLYGQRRADTLRDTTLADLHVPVVGGPASGVFATIASQAKMINESLEQDDEANAVGLSATLHGYDRLPMPSAIEALVNSPDPQLVTASAERELGLTLAADGAVPQWPAVDVTGLPGEAVAEVAKRVSESHAEGLVYLGVPD